MYRDKLTAEEAYIHSEEGYRNKPYRCTSGKLTIGIGWNLDEGIAWEDAVMMFRSQLQRIRSSLSRRLPWFADLEEARQAALVSMAFQMGVTGLMGFKNTLKLIERGDYEGAGKAMLDSRWAKQTPTRAQRTAYMMRYGQFPTT